MNFDQLTAYLDSFDELGVPGSDTVVWQDHKPVYRHFRGCSDYEGKVPVNGQETWFMYSATKMFTCTAALQLIEQGKLSLETPVCEILPAYTMLTVAEGDHTRAAKRPVTIRHLMTMTAGMDYDLDAKAIQNALALYGQEATTRQLVDAMAHKPLCFDPGEDFKYSLCHDVLAAVIEEVSGERFSEYLEKHVMGPLGIRHMTFRMDDYTREHLSALYSRESGETLPVPQKCRYMLSDRYESGGAGLVGDCDSYIRLLDALSCGGVGQTGYRLLQPETVELYRTNQLSGKAFDSYFGWRKLGYSYGLGVRTMVTPSLLEARSPIGEFGWDGAAGAYCLCDPEHKLSIFHAQHVLSYSVCYRVHHPKIRDLVYEAMEL